MNSNDMVTLNFWDLLQYKIWDEACQIKGFSDDFSFGSVYEHDYSFDFTNDELKSLGIRIN